MNLTIDAGNTSIKVMVFNDNLPIFRDEMPKLSVGFLKKLYSAFPISDSIVSAVIPVNKAVIRFLKKHSRLTLFNEKTPIPIKNRYKTPKTLGKDRLSSAVAGHFLFPHSDVLIIDLGTCIKYDLITSKGVYLGGSISPGMNMRFQALHTFTGQLPLVGYEKIKQLTGNTTFSAIQSGVILGIEAELNGKISRYKKTYRKLKVVLSGGDSYRFAKQLNLSIFVASDLVNLGLNEIIRYNVESKHN